MSAIPATPTPEGADARAPARVYRERAAHFRQIADALGRQSRWVSNFRGLAFGTAAVAAALATLGGNAAAGPVALAAAIVFVALVVWHARVIALEDEAQRLARVNADARARVEDAWQDLPDDGARFAVDAHPYSGDLDLFGRGSLYQRLNVAHTRFGQEALAGFLTAPSPPRVVRMRQEAARALAPRLDDRQRLEALSIAVVEPPTAGAPNDSTQKRKKPAEPPDPEPLLGWAESPPELTPRRGLVVLLHVLPVATVLAFAAWRLVGLPAALWAVPFAAQLVVLTSLRGVSDRAFAAVSTTQGAFLRYGPMFELVEGFDLPSELLFGIRKELAASTVRPSAAMRRFERVLGWFELRHNGLIHPFVNAFLLWDLHCVLRLEKWKADAGRHARGWFRALGEVEALASFAALAHDEPGFAWPEIVAGPARFEATGLGHPLIPPARRIENDVSLTEPGHALLVTGSNMSGKSTWLRSMGIAAVMALAGAPVAARKLRLSELAVRSSMKISDSLRQGVSHFYAEVARLKGVLDATSGELPVFFLLDEILHGTNSDERQVGARWILAELLRRGAIGAVSTHDVGLCRLPEELMDRVTQCHFRESVDNGAMTFDYRLRPGPVAGGNALRLMRLVGLEVPLPDDSPAGVVPSRTTVEP